MENFNYQEYRNNLAKDLKEIRKTNPEEARGILEEKNKQLSIRKLKVLSLKTVNKIKLILA